MFVVCNHLCSYIQTDLSIYHGNLPPFGQKSKLKFQHEKCFIPSPYSAFSVPGKSLQGSKKAGYYEAELHCRENYVSGLTHEEVLHSIRNMCLMLFRCHIWNQHDFSLGTKKKQNFILQVA